VGPDIYLGRWGGVPLGSLPRSFPLKIYIYHDRSRLCPRRPETLQRRYRGPQPAGAGEGTAVRGREGPGGAFSREPKILDIPKSRQSAGPTFWTYPNLASWRWARISGHTQISPVGGGPAPRTPLPGSPRRPWASAFQDAKSLLAAFWPVS
jgi:hypothetical protein